MAVKICEHCLNDYNVTIGDCPYCNREKLKNRIAELEHTIEQLSQDIERRTQMYVEIEAENKRKTEALDNYYDRLEKIQRICSDWDNAGPFTDDEDYIKGANNTFDEIEKLCAALED